METYSLRRSAVDPNFLEIVLNDVVVQEIRSSFPIRRAPPSFSSLEEIPIWLAETEEKLAKEAAYRLLGRRSYSKALLLHKLKQKGFAEDLIRKVMEEIEKLGYLSDADLADQLIDQKIAQGYGPLYIEQYLRAKGLDSRFVRKKMDLQKQKESLAKWAIKWRGKQRAKMIAFLLRRGFDISMIQNQ